MGWMQVEPQQRNAHPTKDQSGSMNLPTSVEERVKDKNRKALECYLLWQYRLEKNESTLCNHGRFRKDYVKSTLRSKGTRGRKLLSSEEPNPAGGPSYPPLQLKENPFHREWMGLKWSDIEPLATQRLNTVPHSQGLYKLLDSIENRVLYLGETKDLKNRLTTHRRTYATHRKINYSTVILTEDVENYQRRELENDLIGGYYAQSKSAPLYQFGK
jgi:hypothetical protein